MEKSKKPSQKSRIVQYIRETGSITSWEAYKEIGCTQLAARIVELEKLGWVFDKERVGAKNRWGDPTSFTRYKILKTGACV